MMHRKGKFRTEVDNFLDNNEISNWSVGGKVVNDNLNLASLTVIISV